ncbi:LON peptidase substrate-binding domain-containing protein [Lewinella sp. W8]|uniref:LON peptidase substrate-binding domain-containing protein n=1 Tax=Lewinella sp. W8 TaxID=2528208 RepID=UPI001067301C|nr:LON peptidase substrate-binding domain-containing protein [Lewinella sp. W8]MTB52898.1 peptidase [Lewinella sp. W8]
MTEQLALFPLQLVAYPGEGVNLHIFEPRYRQLISDAEEFGITFGIPTVINGSVRPIATEVKLLEVAKRYPSGESDVRTMGERIFLIENFHKVSPNKLYPGGEVRFLELDAAENPSINEEIVFLTREIYELLQVEKEVRDPWAGFTTYDIAHYVGLTLEQEYELLTLINSEERQSFLLDHLRSIKPTIEQKSNIKARAQLNGHFKELMPPKF